VAVLSRIHTLPEVALLARHANARVTATVYAGLTTDGRERAAAKLVALARSHNSVIAEVSMR
jgi:hypothetical protein